MELSNERLPFDFMNAAGWVKTIAQVREMVKVPYTSHVIVGGYTPPGGEGNNGGTNFIKLSDGSYGNALGLPNDGIPYLKRHGREMVSIIHDSGKKAVLNCSWFVPEDAGILAGVAAELGFDYDEDNRGCPNSYVGGQRKRIPSYYMDLLEEADEHIAQEIGIFPPIGIWEKLSPYVNPEDRVRQSERIIKRRRARVTSTNTVPGFRPRDKDGKPLITAQNTGGYCGLSGKGAKWLAIINAEHFVELLSPHSIGVNGATGIGSGEDLEDFRVIGCTGMQVGGPVFDADDPKPLADIAREWAHLD